MADGPLTLASLNYLKYFQRFFLTVFVPEVSVHSLNADIQPKKNSIIPGGLFEISKSDEKKLDIYEDYPILYKKYYFYYYGKKVMTYTMVKKTSFKFPKERYLNTVKRGYKDCKLDYKHLKKALIN